MYMICNTHTVLINYILHIKYFKINLIIVLNIFGKINIINSSLIDF